MCFNPPAQAGPARAGCPGPWPLGFAVSPRMETPPPLLLLHQPHAETALPPLPMEFHVFSPAPTASCPATHHKALGPALQPLCSPPHCPLTQPVHSRLLYERAVGDSDKGFIQVRLNNNSRCSPLVQHPVASTWKTRRSLKHHFPLVNPRQHSPSPSWPSWAWQCFPGGFPPSPFLGTRAGSPASTLPHPPS